MINESEINGEFAEDLFVNKFKERFGVYPIKTEDEVDKFLHIDYVLKVNKNGVVKESSCDVKYPKKMKRSDLSFSKDLVWVEYTTRGHGGWLFGKSEYIAFLLPDLQNFLMVNRYDLEKYCYNFFKPDNFSKDPELHKIYVRQHKYSAPDVLCLITYDNMKENCKTWIL